MRLSSSQFPRGQRLPRLSYASFVAGGYELPAALRSRSVVDADETRLRCTPLRRLPISNLHSSAPRPATFDWRGTLPGCCIPSKCSHALAAGVWVCRARIARALPQLAPLTLARRCCLVDSPRPHASRIYARVTFRTREYTAAVISRTPSPSIPSPRHVDRSRQASRSDPEHDSLLRAGGDRDDLHLVAIGAHLQ